MRLLKFVVALVLIILALAFAPEMFPDHSVLYEAISKGDLQRLRTLLDRGADPNVRYTFQSSLLKRGKRAYRFGWNEQPLLLYALNYNQVDMARNKNTGQRIQRSFVFCRTQRPSGKPTANG